MAVRFDAREGGLETNPVQLRPLQSGIYTLDELANDIAATNVAAPAVVKAVLQAMISFIVKALLRGEAVHLLGLVQIRVTLGGKFAHVSDVRTQDIKVDVRADVDKTLKAAVVSQIELDQVAAAPLQPQPDELTPLHGTLGSVAAGTALEITGSRLIFDPSQADAGIFARATDGSGEIKVTNVITRTAKKLVFLAPTDLVSGVSYQIVVKARVATGSLNAPLYEGIAPQVITAA